VPIETIEQIGKAVRDPLTDHVVIYPAELLADPRLNFRVQLRFVELSSCVAELWCHLGSRLAVFHHCGALANTVMSAA
jgi:hypothetical protein